MLLTDLADVLRGAGCDVVELDGWKSHHHGALEAVDAILWHHTAGPRTGDHPSLPTVRYGRPGLRGPLSQLLLARDGTYYVVSAGVSWQAGPGTATTARKYGLPERRANWRSIGIEMESTGIGASDWTDAQIEAQGRGGAAMTKAYGVPLAQNIAHAEWAPGRKIDPSRWPGGFDGLRSNIKKYTGSGASTGGSTSGGGSTSSRLKVDGKWGSDTTERLQKRLAEVDLYGGTVDGRIDSQNARWRDDNPGLTTGWDWQSSGYDGSRTIRGLQSVVGVKQDGLMGPATIKALQSWLRTEAQYTGDVDLELWKPSTTIKALQKVLNSKRGFDR